MSNTLLKYFARARIWSDESGQDMVEYSMLVGLMTIVGGSISADISVQVKIIFNRLLELFELVLTCESKAFNCKMSVWQDRQR